MFTPALWSGFYLTIWLFCFTIYSKPWIFDCTGFSAVYNLGIRLRSPLRSWGSFDWSISPTFLKGVPKLLEIFSGRSCTIWLVCPVRSHQGSLLLFPGFWSLTANMVAFFWGLDLPKSSRFSWGVSEDLGRDAFLYKRHPGKFFPCLWFHCLVMEKFPIGFFPSIWRSFGGSRLSLCSMRRRE